MALDAAFQLHFYLSFKTHYLRPMLTSNAEQSLVRNVLAEVCTREQYHLLETDITPDNLRLLLSMRPEQTVSRAVKMLKGNLAHQFAMAFPHQLECNQSKTLWAGGYFAKSSGKVDRERARQYVEAQTSHHGYSGEWTKTLNYRNPTFKSPAFVFDHSFCILDYHIVLATQNRIALFDEAIAPGLFDYLLAVGEKHNFAVDRIGLLPDHLHLIIEAIPNVSVEQCVRAVLENTRHWMTKHYSGVLRQTNAWDVWQPSFYAGTVGEYTTAQVKAFLSGP